MNLDFSDWQNQESEVPPEKSIMLEFGARLQSWFDCEVIDFLSNQAPPVIECYDENGELLQTLTIDRRTRRIEMPH